MSDITEREAEERNVYRLQLMLGEQNRQIERLRAALRLIAGCSSYAPGDVVDVARSALGDQPSRNTLDNGE